MSLKLYKWKTKTYTTLQTQQKFSGSYKRKECEAPEFISRTDIMTALTFKRKNTNISNRIFFAVAIVVLFSNETFLDTKISYLLTHRITKMLMKGKERGT